MLTRKQRNKRPRIKYSLSKAHWQDLFLAGLSPWNFHKQHHLLGGQVFKQEPVRRHTPAHKKKKSSRTRKIKMISSIGECCLLVVMWSLPSWTLSSWNFLQETCRGFGPYNVWPWTEEGTHKVLPIPKALEMTDSCWKREVFFFFSGVATHKLPMPP